MAGGIDWFRWHHGSANDPKFQLVAKKACASVAEVVAVWACLLESASSSTDRGHAGDPDFEAMDCALGLDEGKAERIFERMCERELIDEDGRIVAWEKRQPKREDETALERKRRQRTREHITVTDEESRDVTLSHADVTQCHDRGEERREEEKEIQEPSVLPEKAAPFRVSPCPAEEIVSLYHQHLPMLPAVIVLNASRKSSIRARWHEVCGTEKFDRGKGLEWFAWFFGHVAKSRFLTGKSKDWKADFDFLMTPKKFAKCVEGSYHKEDAR